MINKDPENSNDNYSIAVIGKSQNQLSEISYIKDS